MELLILLLWVILVGGYLNGPIGDPDLWWHITVGRWIYDRHQVPTVDMWNAFSNSTPWRAYSWPHELVYAFVEKFFGLTGLWTLQLVLSTILVGSFIWCFVALSKDRFVGVLLGTIVAVACFQNFALRPQTFVWIVFALSLVLSDAIARRGPSLKYGVAVVALFCLWANSHITTAIGISSVFLWILEPGKIRITLTITALALAGTLLTPYGGGEWLTFFSQTGDPLHMSSIAEFQPATLMRFGAGIIALLLALVIAAVARAPRQFPIGRLVLVLGLVVGGAAVVKFLPFAAVALGAFLAVAWRERSETVGIYDAVERARRACAWLPPLGSAFLLFSIACVVINQDAQQKLNTSITPVAAIDFIKQNSLPTPLLNDFGRGGYVMYRFSDARGELPLEYKVAIDGRTNVNSSEMWKASRLAMEGRPGWDKILELVKPQTILWRRESPFVELLKTSGKWHEVFVSGTQENGFVVLSKVMS